MRPLRIAFARKDDLEEYARGWLQSRSFSSFSGELREVDGAQVGVLSSDGRFQVELCCVRGGMVIPMHTHPHADTVEVGVLGGVRLAVRGVDPFAAVSDEKLPTFAAGRGIRINRDDRHGGVVLPCGAMFLSFQRWVGAHGSVLTDYVGQPLGDVHRKLLA